jgi:cytochrome bd-type quinol oxidase subunit 2
MRQRSRIVAIIGELVSTSMTQHVGMNTEGELGSNARALNHTLVVLLAGGFVIFLGAIWYIERRGNRRKAKRERRKFRL